jgi:hypothetical protein
MWRTNSRRLASSRPLRHTGFVFNVLMWIGETAIAVDRQALVSVLAALRFTTPRSRGGLDRCDPK